MKNEKMILWQTHFSKLDDELFFSYIKTYLGKIKTPYNKQDLIEKLAGFFLNAEHQKTIVSLLNTFEKKLIAAILLLPKPNFENLALFFANETTRFSLSEKIANLTERLLIFKNENNCESVNPFLEKEFLSFAKLCFLIKTETNTKKTNASSFFETTIAGFLSYISFHPYMCKQDGSFKKKANDELSKIFLNKTRTLSILFQSFLNLGLVTFQKKANDENLFALVIDKNKLQTFSSLPENAQASFILAASVMRSSRDLLQKNASLFLSLALSLQNFSITKQSLFRLSFFFDNDEKKITRLSRILSKETSIHENEKNTCELFLSILENAISLSLLHKTKKNETGETFYSFDEIFYKEKNDNEKIFFIDTSFSIRTKANPSLASILPFLFSLEIKKCEASLEFALTKSAIGNFFSTGKTANDFIALLKNASLYEFGKNIETEIREWFTSYNRAKLYSGFVLVLDEKTNARFSKNKNFAIQKISENVYLLDAQNESDAKKILSNMNLLDACTMKIQKSETQMFSFPKLEKTLFDEKKFSLSEAELKTILQNEKKSRVNNSHEKFLLSKLREKKFSKTDEFFFREKIANKIIITAEQLSLDYRAEEIIEARGIDFLGKVHLVETAIKTGDMLELVFAKNDGKMQKYFCAPLEITKDENDAILKAKLSDGEKTFSIRLAKKIKRIHIARAFGPART